MIGLMFFPKESARRSHPAASARVTQDPVVEVVLPSGALTFQIHSGLLSWETTTRKILKGDLTTTRAAVGVEPIAGAWQRDRSSHGTPAGRDRRAHPRRRLPLARPHLDEPPLGARRHRFQAGEASRSARTLAVLREQGFYAVQQLQQGLDRKA